MEEKGKVIKANNKTLTVRFERKTQCSKCGACAFPAGSPHFDIELKNDAGAKEGDTVTVSMPGGSVLLSSALVYLIPLLFTAAGLAIGFALSGENLAIYLGLVMLAAGFLFISFLDKLIKKRGKTPKIISVEKPDADKEENAEEIPQV